MESVIRLKVAEGNRLLGDCLQLTIPSKIEGVGTWDHQTRANVGKNVRHLQKVLTKKSFRSETKIHFGPIEWYDKQERQVSTDRKEREVDEIGEPVKHRYVLKPEFRDTEVEVKLPAEARKGLYILLLLRVHPGPCSAPGASGDFSQSLTPGLQEEHVWPIAEKLGCVRALEEALGIGKGTEVPWKSDEDYAATDAAKEKELSKTGKDVAEALE